MTVEYQLFDPKVWRFLHHKMLVSNSKTLHLRSIWKIPLSWKCCIVKKEMRKSRVSSIESASMYGITCNVSMNVIFIWHNAIAEYNSPYILTQPQNRNAANAQFYTAGYRPAVWWFLSKYTLSSHICLDRRWITNFPMHASNILTMSANHSYICNSLSPLWLSTWKDEFIIALTTRRVRFVTVGIMRIRGIWNNCSKFV